MNRSRYAFATGLMQPGLMRFAVTHGAPAASANGRFVIGSTGFRSAVDVVVKIPARCASVGTNACDSTDSALLVRPWYDPKKNSLLGTMRPPLDPPHWFCSSSGLRGAKKLREFSLSFRWNSHADP